MALLGVLPNSEIYLKHRFPRVGSIFTSKRVRWSSRIWRRVGGNTSDPLSLTRKVAWPEWICRFSRIERFGVKNYIMWPSRRLDDSFGRFSLFSGIWSRRKNNPDPVWSRRIVDPDPRSFPSTQCPPGIRNRRLFANFSPRRFWLMPYAISVKKMADLWRGAIRVRISPD